MKAPIKDNIMKLASTSVTNNDTLANIRDTVRTKDSQIKAMAAQLKLLSDTVALLAKNAKPTDKNQDPNSRGGQSQQMTKPRNMGAYCWTYGFTTIGVIHDSKTCEFKKDGHRNDATYSNCYKGNTYLPVAMHVAIDQQNHAT